LSGQGRLRNDGCPAPRITRGQCEIGGLLGLWQATSDGAKNIVPKIWGGKFPYQVRIQLAIPKSMEVPKTILADLGADPTVGRFDPCLNPAAARKVLAFFSVSDD